MQTDEHRGNDTYEFFIQLPFFVIDSIIRKEKEKRMRIIINLSSSRNACRSQETDNLQTDIIRNRASQYSEPSSRRGSVGVSIEDYFMSKHTFNLIYIYCFEYTINN